MLLSEDCGSLHNNVCESALQIVKGSGAAMFFHIGSAFQQFM